ncbi:MAG: GNAT family N-acetyltransferase [Rhodothermales bacterium]|nr:GNAT family N-acetyltransferase [Rhodothermales bacterium]MBO6778895.1 GNAT family N-acetyltransferase [Rhodothermales bacterium]
MPVILRDAKPEDAPVLVELIRRLADYERLAHEVVADADKLAAHLADDAQPRCHAVLAEADGEPTGFALYYWTYSTFLTDWGIYLEDLFVRESFRGQGIGFALLAELARRVQEVGGHRLTWQVLDWNAPSISFYESLGARSLEEWKTMRLEGEALERVAFRAQHALRRLDD